MFYIKNKMQKQNKDNEEEKLDDAQNILDHGSLIGEYDPDDLEICA
jgi:hypothetical protein